MFALETQKLFMRAGGQSVETNNVAQTILYSKLIAGKDGEFTSELIVNLFNTFDSAAEHTTQFIDDLCDVAVVVCGCLLSSATGSYILQYNEALEVYEKIYTKTEASSDNISAMLSLNSSKILASDLGINYQVLFSILDMIVHIAKFIELDLASAMKTIHENNLTKCKQTTNGVYYATKNEYGKIMKPEGYVAVDLTKYVTDITITKTMELTEKLTDQFDFKQFEQHFLHDASFSWSNVL